MKDEESKEAAATDLTTSKLSIDDYVSIVAKNTEFFSTYNPEVLLGMLQTFAQE